MDSRAENEFCIAASEDHNRVRLTFARPMLRDVWSDRKHKVRPIELDLGKAEWNTNAERAKAFSVNEFAGILRRREN